MSTFEKIAAANSTIKTTPIKGKEYAMVNERIKAFRMVYPDGTIETELLSDEGGKCIFRAVIKVADLILGSGHAYEREEFGQINRTSYIENCETSAVGRALAMCGFGIDVSIASFEEVEQAIANQTISPVTVKALEQFLGEKGVALDTIYRLYKVKAISELTERQHVHIYEKIAQIKTDQEKHGEQSEVA